MMSNMKDMDPEMLKNMAAQSGMSEEQLKQATEKMANVDPKTLQRLASVATYGFKAYHGAWTESRTPKDDIQYIRAF